MTISIDDARRMGEVGGPASEDERLLFESWMAGHCWTVCGTWNGVTYVNDTEVTGEVHQWTMVTRMLWAAWRDRAALGGKNAT